MQLVIIGCENSSCLNVNLLPLSPSASCVSRNGAGPQMRTVPSSEADAMRPGMAGFQLTQLTVRVWPVSSAIGSSPRLCQMYTLWSGGIDGKGSEQTDENIFRTGKEIPPLRATTITKETKDYISSSNLKSSRNFSKESFAFCKILTNTFRIVFEQKLNFRNSRFL